MTQLVVGCPVRDRAWIMERWFSALYIATLPEAPHPHLVFVGDPQSDRETFRLIDRLCLRYSWSRDVVELEETDDGYQRNWCEWRYRHMVVLRNLLLRQVRALEPTLFWSVDSDMLVHPAALSSALGALERFDAVGSKAYMTPAGTATPSFGMRTNNGMNRWDDSGCFPVDIIMAIKLMKPKAYSVDYVFDPQGEDLGWSAKAIEAGCVLGWDGTHTSRHVMAPHLLELADVR